MDWAHRRQLRPSTHPSELPCPATGRRTPWRFPTSWTWCAFRLFEYCGSNLGGYRPVPGISLWQWLAHFPPEAECLHAAHCTQYQFLFFFTSLLTPQSHETKLCNKRNETICFFLARENIARKTGICATDRRTTELFLFLFSSRKLLRLPAVNKLERKNKTKRRNALMRLMLHAYVSYLSAALPINEKINKSRAPPPCVHSSSSTTRGSTRFLIIATRPYRTVEFEGNGVTWLLRK